MTKTIDCKPNEIIAVDSDVLVDYDQLDMFLTNFGFKKAKFIARIPESWASDVSKNILEKVKTESCDDICELSTTVDALSYLFNSTYSHCELLYELTSDQRKIVEVGLKSRKHHIDTAIDKKIVNLAVAKDTISKQIGFEDIRKKRIKFLDTEEVCIRDVSAQLNEDGSVVNQLVGLFERIIDFNEEYSLIDRYFTIELNKSGKFNDETPYGTFLDKLIKKIGFYAKARGSSKVLNIYLDRNQDQQNSKNKKKPETHAHDCLKKVAKDLQRKYKSLFASGLIIKIYPFIPEKQDTHDRWFIGHTAGAWNCPRGAKDTFTEELNFFTITRTFAKQRLDDYNINNTNMRIKLDFGLKNPIVISKDSY